MFSLWKSTVGGGEKAPTVLERVQKTSRATTMILIASLELPMLLVVILLRSGVMCSLY